MSLFAYWTVLYVRYRRSGVDFTRDDFERLRSVDWSAYSRHYNERVPTIEQEFEIWGPYHQHRHEMRYDLVAAAVVEHLSPGGRVLDVGCGSANVADRLRARDAHYVGIDFGAPLIRYAFTKYRGVAGQLQTTFARADAALLPFPEATFDVILMSEVIEHLIRPELAVWEVARVLRPGGIFILTTNNASEVPLLSPLSHPFAWIEKAIGADVPRLISRRPWTWPEKVHSDLLPVGSEDVYLPHTHHIAGETKRLLSAAGLRTLRWWTFEFPPPHSATARILERMKAAGRRAADAIETFARATPVVRRLGTHLFVAAKKTGAPIAPCPPPGVWAGPFSGSDRELKRLGAPSSSYRR